MISRAKLYALGEPLGDSCTRIEGGKRIYGGGDSSSASTTQSSTTNIDKRQVVDTGSVGVTADNSTINVSATDQGAVNSALKMAENTGAGALDAYKALLSTTVLLAGQANQTLQANTAFSEQLATNITDTKTDNSEEAKTKQYLTYAGIAVVVFLAARKM